MDINPASVEKSKLIIGQALIRINQELKSREFLVGDKFSRAELSIASLFAPFCKPEKYGLQWPEEYPEELGKYISSISEQLSWLNHDYENYR